MMKVVCEYGNEGYFEIDKRGDVDIDPKKFILMFGDYTLESLSCRKCGKQIGK